MIDREHKGARRVGVDLGSGKEPAVLAYLVGGHLDGFERLADVNLISQFQGIHFVHSFCRSSGIFSLFQ